MLKRVLEVLLAGMLIASCLAPVASSARVTPYESTAFFVGDAKPMKARVAGNPLDYAGQRIGLDVRNVELPRAWEGNYRLACRFPIIDYVSNRPLYMKQWSEDNCELITREHRASAMGAVRSALELLRNTPWYFKGFFDADAQALSDFRNAVRSSPFSSRYQQALASLYETLLTASNLAHRARRSLTQEDLAFFRSNPGYFLAPDGEKMTDLTGNVDSHFEFIEHARRVGYHDLFSAAALCSDAVQAYVAATKEFQPRDFFAEDSSEVGSWRFDGPLGPLVISGTGNDTLRRDVAILIDLGGDDVYLNNAGGCRSGDFGVALCLDHSGNDHYLAPDERYVQGFGFLGTGMLVDLAGDDEYVAGDFSQGAGIVGVGTIWDAQGDDRFTAQTFCQGAGMFGLGVLLDDSGEDFYDCASLGQGAATTLGLGLLSDLAGDDRYHLSIGGGKDALSGLPGYGQGGALSFRHYPWDRKLTAYGGVGMLVDAEGNDRYRTKGWCDQGGSYIMSLGVLYDADGNDHYTAGTGQGSGIHVTNAILIDENGDDIYEGGFRTGGSGGDRSPGFLIDYHGDDVYRSNTSSYGTGVKPFSYSLFIDYEGNDTYVCARPKDKVVFNDWESFGGVWPESEPNLWPYAICLDLQGTDNYQLRHHTNNSERHSFGHGIHLDLEWSGGDVIGRVEAPYPPYPDPARKESPIPLPKAVETSPFGKDVKQLLLPDTFVRFQAVGRIVAAGVHALPVLVDAIVDSPRREFNRDVLECVHYYLVQDKVTSSETRELARLLKARDEEVRIIIADDLGNWKLAGAEDELVRAAQTDPSAQVRRFALRSLSRLQSRKALPIARSLALKDTSEDVRRVATALLGKVKDDVDPTPLLIQILKRDPGSSVRVTAAGGLGELRDPRAIGPLREAAKSYDVYVQRAAGRALAELNQVEGIGILIESLSFPSIDAFFNYDKNVPNYVAAYSNHDFPESERYDQERWRAWFRENRDKIDIKGSVEAYRALSAQEESLRTASPETQITIYEDLHRTYPDYVRIRKALATKLNEVAWGMVTAPAASPERNLSEGLKHARRAVELEPEANYYDTLIEAYMANGQPDEALAVCREALRRYPGEKMLQDRMKACEKAKSGE
jgi:tetratricopeptide (TPR) repeat protein